MKLTGGLRFEASLKMTDASLAVDPGAPGGKSPCFASSGSSNMDCQATEHHLQSAGVQYDNTPVSLTSRFKNCASGFHLLFTKCLHTSIVFTPTVATLPPPVTEVIATAFLRSRPTVGFLALEAPRIERPSMGTLADCVRAASRNTTPRPLQKRVQVGGGGSEQITRVSAVFSDKNAGTEVTRVRMKEEVSVHDTAMEWERNHRCE